jgi:predicted deacylase
MGGIHGDERIGPNVVINLAEYLLENNQIDEHITYLLGNRYIILYPMANPSGYFNYKRVFSCIQMIVLGRNITTSRIN